MSGVRSGCSSNSRLGLHPCGRGGRRHGTQTALCPAQSHMESEGQRTQGTAVLHMSRLNYSQKHTHLGGGGEQRHRQGRVQGENAVLDILLHV